MCDQNITKNLVNIVIVSYDSTDPLPTVSEYSNLFNVSITVVDNGPHPSNQDMLFGRWLDRPATPRIFVPFAPDRGFGGSCNLAVAESPRSNAICLVNPDAVITLDTVDLLLGALDRSPRLGVVSAWLVKHDGRSAESGGRFPSISELVLGKLAWVQRRTPAHATSTPPGDGHDGVEIVDWVSGAVMMIRREAWDAVGGFDPSFFLYYEDVDLCRRVRAAGWEVGIVPDATAIHESGGSQWRPGTRTRVERIYFESQAYYFRKHYGRLMEWLLRAVRFPYLATSLRRRFLERHGVRIRVASDPA